MGVRRRLGVVQPQPEAGWGGVPVSPPPVQPLPGQRLAGRYTGHDDALGSRRGHGFEGASPELLEELLLALLHGGHGLPRVPPFSALLSATSPARPREPARRCPGWRAGLRLDRPRRPFCAAEAGRGAGPARRPSPAPPPAAAPGAAGSAARPGPGLRPARRCSGAAPGRSRWPLCGWVRSAPRKSRAGAGGPWGVSSSSHPTGRFCTLPHRPMSTLVSLQS